MDYYNLKSFLAAQKSPFTLKSSTDLSWLKLGSIQEEKSRSNRMPFGSA